MIRKLAMIFGWLLIAAGALGGIWLALVTFFTGGLLQIAAGVAAGMISMIIIGICKVLFFWIPGLVVFLIAAILGCIFLEWGMDI